MDQQELQNINTQTINQELDTKQPIEILHKVYKMFTGKKALSLSFQHEGLIILDMLLKNKLKCGYFTLDTGRLHHETYQMMDNVRFKYNIDLETFYPSTQKVQDLTSKKGMFSFKESVANREECCFIRKVEPNQRALKGMSVWFTGIRRSQSEARKETPVIQYHPALNLYKISPLVNMTSNDVKEYIDKNKIPVHPLYKEGYASIGCLPCTRAIKEDEEERAGRWWWESGIKECGLNLVSSYSSNKK